MGGRTARTIVAAATIGVLFLIANLVLSIVNTRQLREESVSILHSNELLLALDNVLKLVVDAETGQRGFVITGEAEYLAPYKVAVTSLRTQMDELQRLTSGDPALQSLMADVRRHIGTKLGELDLTISLRERKGFDLTKEVIALGAGQAEMEALRATVAAMATHETRLLLEREERAKEDLPLGDRHRDRLRPSRDRRAARLRLAAGTLSAVARPQRGADHVAARAAQDDAREHRRCRDHDRPPVARDRPEPGRRAAHRLEPRRCGRAADRPVFRIVHEATRDPVEIPVDRALREGLVVGLATDTVLVRKNGSETPIDDSAAPIRDAAGHVLGCVLVFRDITERKANERALVERARLAAAHRQRHGDPDDGVCGGRRGDDRQQRLDGLSGYSATELATLSDWMNRAYGQRATMMSHVVRSLFEHDRTVDNGEREIITASGEKRVWHFITAPLGRDERGRKMLVTNAVDVTERGRLGRLLADSEARLRLAMDAANYGSWQWEPQTGETLWTDKTRAADGRRARRCRSRPSCCASASIPTIRPRASRPSPTRSPAASTATNSASSGPTARSAGSRRAAVSSPIPSSASGCSG